MEPRAARDPHNSPMSVYEVHLGSWRLGLGYRELAKELVEYVKWLGFTHVEFMPVAEHPFGGSWGYQVTSYFAPTSRFGHPDEFRYLVDELHQAGIGVLLDWVPAHFPKDEWALARFDGEALYEHADPHLGEHPDWGTLIFDFGRTEVRNFLVANALYWLEEFHIDGLRVDAVASMLYLDYSREDGQWLPNRYGGRENLEAISFLQEVNATVYKTHPGAVMIAEESTAFPGVTAPDQRRRPGLRAEVEHGLDARLAQVHVRGPGQPQVAPRRPSPSRWSMPSRRTSCCRISHDEVVHGKGSMLRKMPGDRWQQLANLRAFLAYQWAHPGKQLIFMGTEFGQEAEWSEQHGLDWWLADISGAQGRAAPDQGPQRAVPLHARRCTSRTTSPAGFQWINGGDADRNVLTFIRWDAGRQPAGLRRQLLRRPAHGLPARRAAGGGVAGSAEHRRRELWRFRCRERGSHDCGEGGLDGQPASLIVTLPPLGAAYFKPWADAGASGRGVPEAVIARPSEARNPRDSGLFCTLCQGREGSLSAGQSGGRVYFRAAPRS